MPKALNIQPGDRFGRLVILKEIDQKYKTRRFQCQCDCGKITEPYLHGLRNKHHSIKSCGCYKDEILIQRITSHSLSRHPLYHVRTQMIQRCSNPNHKVFDLYGKRGISVCNEWKNDFMSFYNWAISNGYKKGLSIERVNNDGNYNPENCIWATMKTQGLNKRNVKLFSFQGRTMCLQDWASIIGITRTSLAKRLRSLSIKEAFTKPPTKKYQHYAT